jgi:transposase
LIILINVIIQEALPISDICERYELRPTVFYRWQKQYFEQGVRTFEVERIQDRSKAKTILALEQKLQIKNEVLTELMEEYIRLKKKLWGSLYGQWIQPDLRDNVVEFIGLWSKKANIKVPCFVDWLGITSSKYYHWITHYGEVNMHNGTVPRDHWLEEWENESIVKFWYKNPLEGY